MHPYSSRRAIAVLGPGGVGGLLAGVLARGGNDVVCIARAETAARLRSDGLTVHSRRFGDFTVAVQATSGLREPADAYLIAVKANHLSSALARLPARMGTGGLIVPFLNGIEHISSLRERYPAARVAPATIRVQSSRSAEGHIEHMSPYASIELACGDARKPVEELQHRLVRVGFDVTVRDDETAMVWEKLSFLAPFALVSTHFRASAGKVRTEHRQDMLSVIHEVAAVGRADGAIVDEHAVVGYLDGVPETLTSSMHRDAEAGRTPEIEAIGGAILRSAARHGVDIPVTSRIVDCLRKKDYCAAPTGLIPPSLAAPEGPGAAQSNCPATSAGERTP